MNNIKKKIYRLIIFMDNIKESQKVYISENKYFVIYDFDIRFYNTKEQILTINTYPINPRELIKLISYFE